MFERLNNTEFSALICHSLGSISIIILLSGLDFSVNGPAVCVWGGGVGCSVNWLFSAVYCMHQSLMN